MALHRPRMRRVLCNFGHLIQSLKIKDFDPAGVFIGIRFYPIEMDAISKYCAGTLEELNLNIFVKFDCDLAKPTLSSLKSLTIYCSGFFEGDAIGLFSGCNELKTLRLRRIPCPYMPSMACVVAQRYPKLEQLHIDDYLLNAETLYALLKSNLQLKKLNIFVQTASKSICAVAIELENLEELVLNGVESDYDNVSAFGNLKSLKVLELHDIDDGFVPALNAMGDVPLERFRWFDCPSNVEFTKSIKKMKTLKSLSLATISSPSFEEFLVKLGDELPLLKELELGFAHQAELVFPIASLCNLVERASKLNEFVIHTVHSHLFNQKFYDSMLESLQRRSSAEKLRIKIVHQVLPSLRMHSDLLEVEFSASELYCTCSHCEPPGPNDYLDYLDYEDDDDENAYGNWDDL